MNKLIKQLTTSICFLFLGGCAALGALQPTPKFDPIEYSLISQLRFQAVNLESLCGSSNLVEASDSLDRISLQLLIYSQGLPNNKPVVQVEEKLNRMILEFNKGVSAKNFSEAYCKLKTDIIYQSSGTIQAAIGGKIR